MKYNNLSKTKIEEMADVYISNVISIYEIEKMYGLPKNIIIEIFTKDLYEINKQKAEKVSEILKYSIKHARYMKQTVNN